MNLSSFETKIGIKFNDVALLEQALTHRSFLNEHKGEKYAHNERLEFLGDAVLELVATDYLFKKYPDEAEGELTAYRAAIVNTVSLGKASLELGVNDHLRLSKGEAKDTGRARGVIMADAMEAIIGAIYLDQGYEAAKGFIKSHLFEKINLDEIVEKKLWIDAKSRFQEMAQEETSLTPSYKTVKETGPDHSKHFIVAVFLGDTQIALGDGPSKQEAEQKAAEKALELRGW